MTVRLAEDGAVELVGDCPLEDAGRLQQQLLAKAGAPVDWRACTTAHAAVIQVLLASGAVLRGPPAGHFLKMHLDPLFKRLLR